ncbi:MAG: hypothetical protein V4537_07010 [Pseudomonadota bacterium]
MKDSDTGPVIDLGLGRRRVNRATGRAVTAKKRQRFLDALALTCNVRLAADHAGIHSRTAYRLRHADPVFAAAWHDAIEAAYDRIELMVLEHGGAGVALDTPDGERAAEDGLAVAFDFDRAMAILRQYRPRRDTSAKPRGAAPVPTTREDTNMALLKALAAVRRRLDADAARGA